MKLTKQQLKQVIKEELEAVFTEKELEAALLEEGWKDWALAAGITLGSMFPGVAQAYDPASAVRAGAVQVDTSQVASETDTTNEDAIRAAAKVDYILNSLVLTDKALSRKGLTRTELTKLYITSGFQKVLDVVEDLVPKAPAKAPKLKKLKRPSPGAGGGVTTRTSRQGSEELKAQQQAAALGLGARVRESKLNKSQFKEFIKEEIQKMLNEVRYDELPVEQVPGLHTLPDFINRVRTGEELVDALYALLEQGPEAVQALDAGALFNFAAALATKFTTLSPLALQAAVQKVTGRMSQEQMAENSGIYQGFLDRVEDASRRQARASGEHLPGDSWQER